MPISYRIDRKTGVVFTVADGTLTDAQIVDHKRRLLADPAFEPGMVELSDVRGVTSLDVTTEGVAHMVSQDQADARRLSGYKLAIVASENVVFGMARMYQMRTEAHNPNVRVFRELHGAHEWLGRPPAGGGDARD